MRHRHIRFSPKPSTCCVSGPILLQRHRGQAERALANVDLYLNFSRAYAVRGLRAFAEAMTAAWSDEARAVEGPS